jgi:hypothetical protein
VKIMLGKLNTWLIFLLSIIIGFILLFINFKGIIDFPGLLVIGMVPMVGPGIYLCIFKYNSSKYASLFFILAPLLFILYIFYIQMGVPVGFTDPHNTIVQFNQLFSSNGNIIFKNADTISYNFVGFYVILNSVVNICNLNIIIIASILPPMLTIIELLIAYCLISRLLTDKVALISIMIFGWGYDVILFGQELRTQTMGSLLLFCLLLLILINLTNVEKDRFGYRVVYLFIIVSLVLSSFVVTFLTLIFLSTFIIALILLYILKWPKVNTIQIKDTINALILILVIFISYALYVGEGFDSVVSLFSAQFGELSKTAAGIPSNFGGYFNGELYYSTTMIFRAVFMICALVYLYVSIKYKLFINMIYLFGFGGLLGFALLDSALALQLSLERIYIIASLMMAAVIAYVLIYFLHYKYINNNRRIFIQICSFVFILILIISSITALPIYLIGNPSPVRSSEPIDSISWWNVDLPQYSVSDFLSDHFESRSIMNELDIANYKLQMTELHNNITVLSSDTSMIIGQNNTLILLHDKFYGKEYSNRAQYPAVSDFSNWNVLYSNLDYLIISG